MRQGIQQRDVGQAGAQDSQTGPSNEQDAELHGSTQHATMLVSLSQADGASGASTIRLPCGRFLGIGSFRAGPITRESVKRYSFLGVDSEAVLLRPDHAGNDDMPPPPDFDVGTSRQGSRALYQQAP